MMYNYIKKWKGDAKKMLLNFKMENFRSFKDETFFTMLSSKQKTHNDYVIYLWFTLISGVIRSTKAKITGNRKLTRIALSRLLINHTISTSPRKKTPLIQNRYFTTPGTVLSSARNPR